MLKTFNEESKNEPEKTGQPNANEANQIPNPPNPEFNPAGPAPQETQTETKSVVPEPVAQPKKKGERYFKVIFQAKSHPNDTDDVPLGVNGEVLNIQREKEVVIPERFVECARNAEYPHFKTVPGEKRKIISKVRTYPFTVIEEATEQDYLDMKSEGDRKAREAQGQA